MPLDTSMPFDQASHRIFVMRRSRARIHHRDTEDTEKTEDSSLCSLSLWLILFETECDGFVTPALLAGAHRLRCRSCCISSCVARRSGLSFQRFCAATAESDQHRLQLRHWLLLACGALLRSWPLHAAADAPRSGAAGKEGRPAYGSHFR